MRIQLKTLRLIGDDTIACVLPVSVLKANMWGQQTWISFRRRKRERFAVALCWDLAVYRDLNRPTKINSVRLTTYLYR